MNVVPSTEVEALVSVEDEKRYGGIYVAQELGIYGRLRKISRCGPVLMYRALLVQWRDLYEPAIIAEKVKVTHLSTH